ncbi:PaeR7I family type II restriction endonuclease [Amycolatopsis sp. FBCC-B4732]|uniref:PaeR7I family type II restriction endonuclease n=1 Tax=Amycolatopsis sp. FBCC-B4732 TaxID=3079339 RepID=UPI001FF5918A|nr:PaeR7I family type II restriction endonuclease [Amycolatopsis sp. FBCC-B4732]UOX90346.1 PaeR7I family type II restriction endonuclease [Amycolatopsis sp. FBCC-B4732]
MLRGGQVLVDAATRARIDKALQLWVSVRAEQAERSSARGTPQQGRRSSVTGGRHLEGVCDLVVEELEATGAQDLELRRNKGATLAGYYRPTKSWDLLVLQHGSPVLAVEFKSMSGSEGKNLNNRADEVFGIAEDARQAEAHGLLPPNLRRAYIFVMGINADSTRPIGLSAAHGHVDEAFNEVSYLGRMATMCHRMRETGLYHLTWAVGVHEDVFDWDEPNPQVGWDRFADDLHRAFARGEATKATHP